MNTPSDKTQTLTEKLRLALTIEEARERGETVEWQYNVGTLWIEARGLSLTDALDKEYELRLKPISTESDKDFMRRMFVGEYESVKTQAPIPRSMEDTAHYNAILSATDPALVESIAHWRRLATGRRNVDETIGPKHCALCQEYREGAIIPCEGCPVMKRTGRSECIKSPYNEAREAYQNHGLDSPQFLDAAKVELEFLEDLVVQEDKKTQTWTPKFKVGDRVRVTTPLEDQTVFVSSVGDKTYQVVKQRDDTAGVWFGEDELELAPWSLDAHILRHFGRALLPTERWHREGWTEEMLKGAWRPLLHGEMPVKGDEVSQNGKDFWTQFQDDRTKSVGISASSFYYRTRRPLPTPITLIPLDAGDWMKDGPWWVRTIDRATHKTWLATEIHDNGTVHSLADNYLMAKMERSNDGIHWMPCSKPQPEGQKA